jgi:hypothetical protein
LQSSQHLPLLIGRALLPNSVYGFLQIEHIFLAIWYLPPELPGAARRGFFHAETVLFRDLCHLFAPDSLCLLSDSLQFLLLA